MTDDIDDEYRVREKTGDEALTFWRTFVTFFDLYRSPVAVFVVSRAGVRLVLAGGVGPRASTLLHALQCDLMDGGPMDALKQAFLMDRLDAERRRGIN